MKNNKLTSITLVLGCIFCCSIYAQQENNANNQINLQPSQVESARVIYLDPQSGQLTAKRPVGVEPLRLSEKELNAMSKSSEGLTQEEMPDGSIKINFQGRFQNFSTLTLDKDGQQKHQCITGDGIKHVHQADQGDEK